MVTRRNYFAITLVMLAIIFLFMFSSVTREALTTYGTNDYADNSVDLAGRSQSFDPLASDPPGSGRDQVAFIGGSVDEGLGVQVRCWAAYTKRALVWYSSLDQFERAGQPMPQLVVIDGQVLDWTRDTGRVNTLVEEGTPVICCGLPDPELMQSDTELRDLFGILQVRSTSIPLAGIYLLDGFLVGGPKEYWASDEDREEMSLESPWYLLRPGCQTYVKGLPQGETAVAVDLPVLIWRHAINGTAFFAVDAEYMGHGMGLGVLSALASQATSYQLYPIVNAKTLVLGSFPGVANENVETMQRLYNRSLTRYETDLLWPGIIMFYDETDIGLSCMITPQFDYQDGDEPIPDMLLIFMRQFKEYYAEAGLSAARNTGAPISQKLDRDSAFLQSSLPDYTFASFYRSDLSDDELSTALSHELLGKVNTVVEDCAWIGRSDTSGLEPFGFLSENVTFQRATLDGYRFTILDDLRVRSMMTALGYGCEMVDAQQMIFPDGITKIWSQVGETLSANTVTCWSLFKEFDNTTLSENDSRIRNLLTMDYTQVREGDRIRVQVTGSDGPTWFILRTHGEDITAVSGGSWKELEREIYLIELDAQEAVLTLRNSTPVYDRG